MPLSRQVTGIGSGSRRSLSLLDRAVRLVTTREIGFLVVSYVGTRSRAVSSRAPEGPFRTSAYTRRNTKMDNLHATLCWLGPWWIEGSRHYPVASPGPYWKRCSSYLWIDLGFVRVLGRRMEQRCLGGDRNGRNAHRKRGWTRDTGAMVFIRDLVYRFVGQVRSKGMSTCRVSLVAG
jgi:hypothetical protein